MTYSYKSIKNPKSRYYLVITHKELYRLSTLKTSIYMNVNKILDKIKDVSVKNATRITKALDFAEKAHEGQKRFSGEPYVLHPYHVAQTLAEFGMDTDTIIAGLLHDVCEDANVSSQNIEKKFGKDVAFLVSGVTKLGRLKYQGEERYAENLRKMFLAIAQDVRVVLIKLADRLHNMQTLKHVPKRKQKRIAQETIEIYSSLAHRLGMGKLRDMLQDLAFPFAMPGRYDAFMKTVEKRLRQKEAYAPKVKYRIKEELEKENIYPIDIKARIKNKYSFWRKLKRHKNNLDEIYDIVAFRIIVKNITECYATLGIVHKFWRPLPGRVKDYIAFPKPNGYQSIHTTVFCMDGVITEFQIRTEQMHKEAEDGIAAHWAYVHTGKQKKGGKIDKKIEWIEQIREWQNEVSGTKEFLENLKIDVFKNRIFVFTPKGDVINLPEEATSVDFAYLVHSEIGNHCAGSKVNGKMTSLHSILHNGDVCEILTQKNKKPSPSWLDFVKTTYAKSRIRSYLAKDK